MKHYELPEIEVVEVEAIDIVTVSCPGDEHAGEGDCLVYFP